MAEFSVIYLFFKDIMKKHNLIKRILAIALVLVVSVAGGLWTGSMIVNKHFNINNSVVYNPDDLREDFNPASVQGKDVTTLSAKDAYLLALYNLGQSNYYKKESIGDLSLSVGVTQYTHSTAEKNGDVFTNSFCTTSSYYKSAGKTTFKKGENISITKGSPSGKTLDTVAWSDKTENYTYDEYSEKIGRDPSTETSIIISSKTILSQEKIKTENGLTTFKIQFDPKKASCLYINEIAYQSGTDKSSINFQLLEIEFTVDSSCRLVSLISIENYGLKYSGIPVTLSSVYNTTVTYKEG